MEFKCKKCGSTNVTVEKRINGNCICQDCGNTWKNGTEQPELTTAEKSEWLLENETICNEPHKYIAICRNSWEYFYFEDKRQVENLYGDFRFYKTLSEAISAAYDFVKEMK